ncbi:MAG TPA: lysophospholipid acyltransferase family protein [bacterium]|jgi:lysophospholipid acyltransferase (LPLAT)-like uncharacterized protein|nr:lysophospholipid acyltransferase family protein [bacterium]
MRTFLPQTCRTFSFKQNLALAVLPPCMALGIGLLARTWRVRSSIHPHADPGQGGKPLIFALWHETVITIIGHWRGYPIQGLASQSFDGELTAGIMRHLGYPPPTRGSSSKGGAEAMLSHGEALQAGRHVAITVDGPRGPAYHAKPGILRVARDSGFSVVPTACVASPDWRLRTWDRTQVPPPFAKVAFVLGRPIPSTYLSGEEGLKLLHSAMARANAQAVQILMDETKAKSSFVLK